MSANRGEFVTLIFMFTSEGEIVRVVETNLENQRLLHVSHQTGNFYIASGWLTLEYDSMGRFIRKIKIPQQVNKLCTIGFNGEFVVNIYPEDSVDLFDSNGNFVRKICKVDANSVADLFVINTGRLLISLPYDHKVCCFK